MNHLLEFYGNECPCCICMREIIDQLDKKDGIKIESLEVWHNKENEKFLLKLNKDLCKGVPFFYNMKTKKWICGETSYEELKSWAQDK